MKLRSGRIRQVEDGGKLRHILNVIAHVGTKHLTSCGTNLKLAAFGRVWWHLRHANASGAGKFPSHEASAQCPLPGLDTYPAMLRVRFKEVHRSLPHRSARHRPEIPGLFSDPALRETPPHWQRQLSSVGAAKVRPKAQPGHPGDRPSFECEANHSHRSRMLHCPPRRSKICIREN